MWATFTQSDWRLKKNFEDGIGHESTPVKQNEKDSLTVINNKSNDNCGTNLQKWTRLCFRRKWLCSTRKYTINLRLIDELDDIHIKL